MSKLKLISGNSNPNLVAEIGSELGEDPCDTTVDRFPDGEIHVHIQETVRGKSVFVIQSIAPPVNENLMELLLMIDALKRASAQRIAAVIPYYGYGRQDRKQTGRVPISAKLVANLISTAGADRVLTIDLHTGQLQGFFDIPVDNLRSDPVFAKHYQHYAHSDSVAVVSPDVGGAKRARKVAQRLSVPLVIAEKKRHSSNHKAEIMKLIGDVDSKRCLIVDDLVSTGGTLIKVSEALEQRGAAAAEAVCTHGLFAQDALQRINGSAINRVTVTNTIYHEQAINHDCINYISIGRLFATTIKRIHENKSVSTLFPHS